ncbi:hypothetical protein RhiLY_12540 [Ceratobasidium sp. AG-Ba]|nr:hypothetical protein RhiLY_12540 [Ceratobasidium sp. AG-Ba]
MGVDSTRIVYFTLQIFGLVTLPILTYTSLFSPTVKRHVTVPNYLFLWAFSSAVACMLLFSGQIDDPEPSKTLCRTQSALMLVQPAGMAAAALALVWKLWSLARNVGTHGSVSQEPWWLTVILVGSPYAVWGIGAAVYAVLQVDTRVKRVTFYCTSDSTTLGMASGFSASILLVLCLFFEIWTMVIAYKRYTRSHRLGRAEVGDVSVPLFTRVMAFAVVIFLGLVLSLLATFVFSLVVPDIIVASMGPIMFIIFSSQGDILAAWRIYRPRHAHTDSGLGMDDEISVPERPHLSQPPVAHIEIPFGRSHASSSSIYHIPVDSKSARQVAVHVHQTVLSPDDPLNILRDKKSVHSLSPSYQ